jgi:hypothetical protein
MTAIGLILTTNRVPDGQEVSHSHRVTFPRLP